MAISPVKVSLIYIQYVTLLVRNAVAPLPLARSVTHRDSILSFTHKLLHAYQVVLLALTAPARQHALVIRI